MTNKELAEALREISEKNSVSGYKRSVCAEAADALANSETHIAVLQREIEKLRKQVPQWVSVNERLPEPTELVLTLSKSGGMRVMCPENNKYDWTLSVNSWHHFLIPGTSVTHWMPLPEPPSTEGVE